MVTETKEDTKYLNTKIMDTRDLQDDLTEFYGIDYVVDQSKADNREYAGSTPPSELSRKVQKFEEDLENSEGREEFRKEQISNLRNFNRLAKMDPAQMDWNDLELWNELKTEFPNTNIRKSADVESEAEGDGRIATIHGPSDHKDDIKLVYESLNELEHLADERNIDVADAVSNTHNLLSELFKLIQKNPEKIVSKGIKKGMKSYIVKSARKSTQSLKKPGKPDTIKKQHKGRSVELIADNSISNIGVSAGESINIFENGTWQVRK